MGWDPREREHVWQHNSAYPIQQSYGPAPPGGFPSSNPSDSDPSDGPTDPDGNPIDPADIPDPTSDGSFPVEGSDDGMGDGSETFDPSQDHKDLNEQTDSDGGMGDGSTDTSSGAFGCFLAGTQVLMSNGSTKAIETIEVGEYVFTYDEYANEYVSKQVIETYEHEYEGEYLVVNDTLRITPNHITYINGVWERIDSAVTGDMLLSKDYSLIPIESIEVFETTENVYNLEIDEVHTYMAEGYLVHNVK
jgi:hypothetical protein